MFIPFLSSLILYGAEDGYTTADKYGGTGPATDPYGSDYGTGAYSEYNSESGQYTTTIEIVGYDSASDDGYGYMAGGTDGQYSTGASAGGSYGYAPDDTMHSYRDVTLDYVLDVLDDEPESGDALLYRSPYT